METAAEKPTLVKLLNAIAICVLLVGLFIILTENRYASTANQHASVAEDSPAVAEDSPTAIECGSCGAHVYEYWYVENINDGTPVDVCRYCYENYMENTVAENTATEN